MAEHEAGQQEIRFALAMNGGVSLAVWIGGVCNELLRLVRAGEALADRGAGVGPAADWSPYEMLCWVTDLRPRVDVMTGASAGGMNGVFLALGLIYGHQDLAVLRQVWLDNGSFAQLLRDPIDAAPPSLLKGDDYFLVELEKAITLLANGTAKCPEQIPIDLQLTLTALRGQATERVIGQGTVLKESRFDFAVRFRRGDTARDPKQPDVGLVADDAKNPPAPGIRRAGDYDDFSVPPDRERRQRDLELATIVKRLARACRTTASFPGAFEPSLVRLVSDKDDGRPTDAYLDRHVDGLSSDSYMIDGGTLVNLPVREAIEAIIGQSATGAVRRVFALVVPDPSIGAAGAVSLAPPQPTEVIGSALSSIPSNQVVGRFLDELEEANHDLERTRKAREALLPLRFGGTAQDREPIRSIARDLRSSYIAGRLSVTTSAMPRELETSYAVAHPGKLIPPGLLQEWTELLKTNSDDLAWVPPTIPDGDDGSRWGASTVRRSATRALHIIRLLETNTTLPPIGQVQRAALATARSVIIDVVNAQSGGFPWFRQLDWTISDPPAALKKLVIGDAWKATSDEVGRSMATFATQLARGASRTASATRSTTAEALQLLLDLEVVENTFGTFNTRPEQMVETLRIDSLAVSPLDPYHRGFAAGKVAGVQLGHFGSFLKATWRANDWMWGRLDGSFDLVDVMLGQHEQLNASRVAQLNDILLGKPETTPERPAPPDPHPAREAVTELTELLKRRIHAGILVEETVTLLASIDMDRQAGSVALGSARSIEQVAMSVPAMPLQEAAPIEFHRFWANAEDYGRRLLTANRIGEETIADEAGGDLLTKLAVTAVATGTTAIRAGGPKVLRGPLAIIRYVALLAWGLLQGAGRGGAWRVAAGSAFGAGIGIVAIDIFTTKDLGVVFTVGLGLAIAGTLIGLSRAPLIGVPLLVVGLLPSVLVALPSQQWRWVPKGLWPSPWFQSHDWIRPLAFIVAAILIGALRRPMWMQNRRRDRVAADRALGSASGGLRVAGGEGIVEDSGTPAGDGQQP